MIEIKNLSKTYYFKDTEVHALKNVNLKIEDGDIYGIIGLSGAGKSTLVRSINMLERPTDGEVFLDNIPLSKLSKKELSNIRKDVTMIFQSFNLLMQRTCLKNVCFPLELIGTPKKEAINKAKELLELVGLPDKADSYPAQLSGGQMQRVAIARALATNPKVLLCDEATSALDPNTTHQILELLKKINRELNITIIIITHQMSVVEDICNKVAIIDNGEIKETGYVTEVFSNPKSIAAKRLVFPETVIETNKQDKNEHIIRLVFNGGETTNTPLIAKLALDKKITANILSANTKNIDGAIFGNMLLGINGTEKDFKEAITYFKENGNVFVEEVKEDVQ